MSPAMIPQSTTPGSASAQSLRTLVFYSEGGGGGEMVVERDLPIQRP